MHLNVRHCALLALFALANLSRAQQPSSSSSSSTTTDSIIDFSVSETTTTTGAPTTTDLSTSTTTAKSTTENAGSNGEPLTSTTDTISVNSDETLSTAEGPDSSETPDTDDGSATGEGLESKSISHDEPEANAAAEKQADKLLAIDQGARPTLPARLNMTQVDQMYVGARRNEQETAQSWHRMGKKLKKGIGSIIGAMIPMALNMSQEARISSNCSGSMLKWVLSMNQLKSWSLRMLDASGKPIAGLLEGSMTMFGNYRQCLKIRAPDEDEIEFTGSFKEYFRGKYCIIQAKPWLPEKSRFYNLNTKLEALMRRGDEEGDPAEVQPDYERTVIDELSEWALAFNYVNIRYDICVPSLCKREDIQKAVNYLLRGIDLKARVLRCEMDAMEPGATLGMAADVETGSSEWAESVAAASQVVSSTGQSLESNNNTRMLGEHSLERFSQLGWLLLPLVAITLVLISTALSLTTNSAPADEATGTKVGSSKLGHTIHSLSLKRSLDSHLSVDYDQLADDKPLALYGVRFLLVLWVILVESAVNLKFEYLRELLMLKDLIFWWPMQFIVNSTLQYDSFILLTAFTMGYKNCLNDCVNNGKAVTRFVLDKYIRLMPSIMVMVALAIFMPLIYRGPVWNDYVITQSAVCKSTGWVNSIFLQNYLPFDKIVSNCLQVVPNP